MNNNDISSFEGAGPIERLYALAIASKAGAKEFLKLDKSDFGEKYDVLYPLLTYLQQYPWESLEDRQNYRQYLNQYPFTSPMEKAAAIGNFDRWYIQRAGLRNVLPTFASTAHSKQKKLDEGKRLAHEAAKLLKEGGIKESVADKLTDLAGPQNWKGKATTPPPFDLNRLPSRITEAAGGLSAINPYLGYGHHLLAVFVIGGALIGKRMTVQNAGNTYYPNLWGVSLAPPGIGKTGSYMTITKCLKAKYLAPSSPTFEALCKSLGRNLNNKDGQRYKTQEELDIEIQDFQDYSRTIRTGKLLFCDEMNSKLATILGDRAQNLSSFLDLSTSGISFTQDRQVNGPRVIGDLCFSLYGFSQTDTWATAFSENKYRTTGFLSRFLISCPRFEFINTPTAQEEEWTTFVGKTEGLVASMSNQDGKSVVDDSPFADLATHTTLPKTPGDDWCRNGKTDIDAMLVYLEGTTVYKALVETLGDIAEIRSKIIIHAVKMAMVCELYDPHKFAEHLKNCAELATYYFFWYYRELYHGKITLSARDQNVLSFIRSKTSSGGVTISQLQNRFNFKTSGDTWTAVNFLEDQNLIHKQQNAGKKGYKILATQTD